ncbi:MAG: CotH kinase family protein [Spirochaetota bacterium]
MTKPILALLALPVLCLPSCVLDERWGPAAVSGTSLPVLYLASPQSDPADPASTISGLRIYSNARGSFSLDGTAPGFLSSEAPIFSSRAAFHPRGHSTLGLPKQSYALELRDPLNPSTSLSAGILGFARDNDFVLHDAYLDKSLMRNQIAYGLSNDIGLWAPRTQFVEVYADISLDGVDNVEYQGVYLLVEKIKLGPARVNMTPMDAYSNAEPEITGGYILKFDIESPGDVAIITASGLRVLVDYPNPHYVTEAQKAYIKSYLDALEASFKSAHPEDPQAGYARFLDPGSFVDDFLLTELYKNVDGYRRSSFMNKDRGGKLKAGPVWDYDIALGNADFSSGSVPDGYGDDMGKPIQAPISLGWELILMLEWPTGGPPWWWASLLQDPGFRKLAHDRWTALRQGPLSDAAIEARIASAEARIDQAVDRNFARWGNLGSHDWSNPVVTSVYREPSGLAFNPTDPASWSQIGFLRYFLLHRAAWMDSPSSWEALDIWAADQAVRTAQGTTRGRER